MRLITAMPLNPLSLRGTPLLLAVPAHTARVIMRGSKRSMAATLTWPISAFPKLTRQL
jgi:hypothetical protein